MSNYITEKEERLQDFNSSHEYGNLLTWQVKYWHEIYLVI